MCPVNRTRKPQSYSSAPSSQPPGLHGSPAGGAVRMGGKVERKHVRRAQNLLNRTLRGCLLVLWVGVHGEEARGRAVSVAAVRMTQLTLVEILEPALGGSFPGDCISASILICASIIATPLANPRNYTSKFFSLFLERLNSYAWQQIRAKGHSPSRKYRTSQLPPGPCWEGGLWGASKKTK